jgi:hypothetical protein
MLGFSIRVVVAGADTLFDFRLEYTKTGKVDDFAGKGRSWTYTGTAANSGIALSKVLSVNTYNDFPGWAFLDVSYINTGKNDIIVNAWTNTITKSKAQRTMILSSSHFNGNRKAGCIGRLGFYQKNFLG